MFRLCLTIGSLSHLAKTELEIYRHSLRDRYSSKLYLSVCLSVLVYLSRFYDLNLGYYRFDLIKLSIIKNFLEDRDVGILTLSTKFELDQ